MSTIYKPNGIKLLCISFLILLPAWVSGQDNWIKHSIDDDLDGARRVFAVDLDDDGDTDVLGAGLFADEISWWENDGNIPPTFEKAVIADNFFGAASVFAIDLDDDGDIDVLGAGSSANEIAWWENDGYQNFTWHVVDDAFYGAYEVYAVDLDGDGDVDILAVASEGNDVAWWRNDGNQNFTKFVVHEYFGATQAIVARDVDGDDDYDILATASLDDDIAWWENTEDAGFLMHMIDADFNGAVDVDAVDLDSDGDQDVLGAAWDGDCIAWWQNDGNQNFTKNIIAQFNGASEVRALDLDSDTDMDIIASGFYADEVAWWENDGSQNFIMHTIGNDFNGAVAIYAADLDGDDDLDILGAAFTDNEIAWWENDLITSIEDNPFSPQPTADNILLSAFPNPFNASTVIEYSLPVASDVIINIYNVMGCRVETLCAGTQPAGNHQVVWNATDRSSGIYFYRIQAGDYAETKKMLLLK